MSLLADVVLDPESARRRAAHASDLLTWGIGLSGWVFLTGVCVVAGVAVGLRHAIDPPSPNTRRLGLWTAAGNGVLALASVSVAVLLRRTQSFGGFSLDMAVVGGLMALVQAALAAVNAWLALARAPVVPDDTLPRR